MWYSVCMDTPERIEVLRDLTVVLQTSLANSKSTIARFKERFPERVNSGSFRALKYRHDRLERKLNAVRRELDALLLELV